MNKHRRPSSPWLIAFLVIAIGFVAYLNVYVIPTVPPPFVPTPTPTRNPQSFAEEAEAFLAEGRMGMAKQAYQDAIKANPQELNNYLTLARLQLFSGEYEAARVNAENALLLDKTKPEALALLAWTKGFMGEYLEAEADVKAAIELDPNHALSHAVHAFILALQVDNNAGELGTVDRAIEKSRQALEYNPNLMESRWARGYVLEITSNYEDAIQQLQAAIEINDTIAALHLALGRNYLAVEEYDQAVFEFTKAYSLNPTDSTPNWYISRVYARIGEFAKAVQYAEQAMNDAPDDPYMHGNLGSMYYRDLQYNRAIESLGLAVRGGMTDDGVVVEGIPLSYSMTVMEFYSRYGLALARVNRCNEGVQVAQAMLQTVPDDETAVYNAEEIIRICQEFQDTPPTPSPTVEGEEGATAPTQTPEAQETEE
ncbi:MAG: tetratricopeptide repeat protein [Brevefilum sp.]